MRAMTRSVRKGFGVLLVLAMVVTSCGDDSSLSQEGLVEVDYGILDKAELFIDELGDPEGLDAVLYAFERGYTWNQILTVPYGLRLDAAGNLVADQFDEIAMPDGPRVGLIALPVSASTVQGIRGAGRSLFQTYRDIEVFRRTALDLRVDGVLDVDRLTREAEVAVLAILLLAVHGGYSAEQIIEALILGPSTGFEDFGGRDCFAMRVGGDVVVPATDPAPYLGEDPAVRAECRALMEERFGSGGAAIGEPSDDPPGAVVEPAPATDDSSELPESAPTEEPPTAPVTYSGTASSIDDEFLEVYDSSFVATVNESTVEITLQLTTGIFFTATPCIEEMILHGAGSSGPTLQIDLGVMTHLDVSECGLSADTYSNFPFSFTGSVAGGVLEGTVGSVNQTFYTISAAQD